MLYRRNASTHTYIPEDFELRCEMISEIYKPLLDAYSVPSVTFVHVFLPQAKSGSFGLLISIISCGGVSYTVVLISPTHLESE